MEFLSRSRARFKDFSRAVPDLKTRVAQSCPWLHFAEKNSYRRHFIGFQETRWPCSWSQVFGKQTERRWSKLLCFLGFHHKQNWKFLPPLPKESAMPLLQVWDLLHSLCDIWFVPSRINHFIFRPHLSSSGDEGGAREKHVSRFKTPSKLTGSLHLHWIALDGESIWTRW